MLVVEQDGLVEFCPILYVTSVAERNITMATTVKRDPICGMVLEPGSSTITWSYANWTYLFCCQECLEIFKRSPNDCVLHLAHNQSGSIGHRCQLQRDTWQLPTQGALR